MSSTMKAVVTVGDKKFEIKDVAVPAIGQGEVLVKVYTAAQNPVMLYT